VQRSMQILFMPLLFSLQPVQELNTIFYYGCCSSTTVQALEIDIEIPGSMRVVLLSMFVTIILIGIYSMIRYT
jgi:hypothetical protein